MNRNGEPRHSAVAYGGRLFAQHAALLAASGIPPELARARGYVTVDTKKRLADLNIVKAGRSVPGMLIPLLGVEGRPWGYQYRPDAPRLNGQGKPVKYETPVGQHNRLDVPPGVGTLLADPSLPLLVTEGSRKADAAAARGLACVSLLGVYGWRGSNAAGGKTALADWNDVALNGRRVVLAFDSDVAVKPEVHRALAAFAGYLGSKQAHVVYLHLPHGDGAKVGLDDWLADGHEVADLWSLVHDHPPGYTRPKTTRLAPQPAEPVRSPARPAEIGDPTQLLAEVEAFLGRFVAFPSAAARVATTLWAAHTHVLDAFESTPRLAFLSPEPESGKTRALEVLELLTPHPMLSINTTPAALFRSIGSEPRPTVLFDECDTIFGPKAKEHEEIRGLLNAGHRRSGVAYRCVGEGAKQEVVAFPAFAAVALAGLGDLPDTITGRSVVVGMRRRAADERVEPFRARAAAPVGHALRDRLAAWAQRVRIQLAGAWPTMPEGVTDRPADVWEPLLAVADAAGGEWPVRGRAACVELTRAAAATAPSLGVRLLADLREVFGDADTLHTETILDRLHKLDEAPWGDLRGKPLDARGLARRLAAYGVHSVDVKLGGVNRKGYRRADLWDAWHRYLPPPDQPAGAGADRWAAGTPVALLPDRRATSATSATPSPLGCGNEVADQVAPPSTRAAGRATSATPGPPPGLTYVTAAAHEVAKTEEGALPSASSPPRATSHTTLTVVAPVAQVAHRAQGDTSPSTPSLPSTACTGCGEPVDPVDVADGYTTHAGCGLDWDLNPNPAALEKEYPSAGALAPWQPPREATHD
ncbi:MAG: DUF3631 domain-containing protein [Mycobacterium leprae]